MVAELGQRLLQDLKGGKTRISPSRSVTHSVSCTLQGSPNNNKKTRDNSAPGARAHQPHTRARADRREQAAPATRSPPRSSPPTRWARRRPGLCTRLRGPRMAESFKGYVERGHTTTHQARGANAARPFDSCTSVALESFSTASSSVPARGLGMNRQAP